MAGVAGRSGTNKGKDKPWADALRLVVFRQDAEGKRRLLAIAERCAAAAESGDMQAIKEIGDRLDGRPAQALELSGETTHNYVARMPAPVKGMDEWQSRYLPSPTPPIPTTKQ